MKMYKNGWSIVFWLFLSCPAAAVAQGGPASTKIVHKAHVELVTRAPAALGRQEQQVIVPDSGHVPAKRLDQAPQSTRTLTVPDVLGLSFSDAESVLSVAGFKPKVTFEDAPDPSVLYGNVRETVPHAGALPTAGIVELKVPRAAFRVGIGALALNDAQRRIGFDLDEGRYEEVFRGADIVLRAHDGEWHVSPGGAGPEHRGFGDFIEPSDGATLATLNDARDISFSGLGSALYFIDCEIALKRPISGVEISLHTETLTTICVRTSRHQLSVVQFNSADNPIGHSNDYAFHHAIFPQQRERTLLQRIHQ